MPIFSLFANSRDLALIDAEYIRRYLTFEAPWADSHGASGDYLGTGMLYYALVYMRKAKLCVCLGSGGGFVPRIMRQAQRDLQLENSKTILVDGNMGNFGRPQWMDENHFFKKEFPEIEIIIDSTHHAKEAHGDWKIDYLHIDADHSFNGAYSDFQDYLPLMNKGGIITLHDTAGGLPCAKLVALLKRQGHEIVNFKEFGQGVAIIYLKR